MHAAVPQARFSAITVAPGGFTAPAVVPQDATSFRVTTTDPDGAYIGLIGLREGVSLQRYLADLEQAYDDTDREAAMAGSRAVERDAVMYGGAAVLPDVSVTFTPRLRPGTYYLIDFKDVGSPGLADKVRKLRVVGGHGGAAVPRAEAEIVQVQTVDGPRFRAPAELRAGAAVRVTNHSRQFNEAIFMPVREGTTRAQVGAFFAAMEGGPAAPYPFVAGPVGMVPLSPGRSTVISAALRPGTYALVTWMTDYRTGRMHAAQGMHEIITVK
ncbi:hypothetical protein ABZ801_38135 [Actinomadura sp. NPDC047616]|uniref:hypothetical protein n=1 Tax=Actinomadura sp. NPDC047616 TaxID=3155914 RepID=UPI0033C05A13